MSWPFNFVAPLSCASRQTFGTNRTSICRFCGAPPIFGATSARWLFSSGDLSSIDGPKMTISISSDVEKDGIVRQEGKRRVLDVEAPSRRYPIFFGDGLIDDAELFSQYVAGDKVLVVTNETVGPLYLERMKKCLQRAGKKVFEVVLPDGETYKSMKYLTHVLDACMEFRLDRKSTIIALGGGVIGDIAGFAAASFVRGIPYLQVPTTLLAVVDSSVGGKTAVNHPKGKNMIGAFYQPHAVIVDRSLVQTLDERQRATGIAEIVKYGLIRDEALFVWCEENMEKLTKCDPDALQYAMERSCINKAAIVKMDERESGIRATLNLGHTFGHAIEGAMGYGNWLHGEAISAGMVMALEMSMRVGLLKDKHLLKRLEWLLCRAALPIRPPPSMGLERFMTFMMIDKKVQSGVLHLVLLEKLGKAIVTSNYPEEILFDTIMSYQQLYKKDPGNYERMLGGMQL
eukprot:Plantae.Rhodophyta-Hildenbrandia_rubra.ctg10407.p1 GENE.Plantae.Rhodophyta-Hildenbrandia_rubra.ctg10407~~Plantae.Rhodophyta-Hildenbrandia_rubra.ctg10407.p1  ORF type:complete len:458 (+),score=62.11 Plantae.Rhodophyta-Hildenbrandia_rubra.ctg10407:86-1459(+)